MSWFAKSFYTPLYAAGYRCAFMEFNVLAHIWYYALRIFFLLLRAVPDLKIPCLLWREFQNFAILAIAKYCSEAEVCCRYKSCIDNSLSLGVRSLKSINRSRSSFVCPVSDNVWCAWCPISTTYRIVGIISRLCYIPYFYTRDMDMVFIERGSLNVSVDIDFAAERTYQAWTPG